MCIRQCKRFILLLFSLMIFSNGLIPNQGQAQSSFLKEATALNKLGLFQGSSKGFELERAPNRAEAAVMIVRLLGMENEALSSKHSHKFIDVPEWASPYVGYLVNYGITHGVNEKLYGSDTLLQANDYVTLVLRALAYHDDQGDFEWQNAAVKAEQIGLITSELAKELKNSNFLRGQVAAISFNALKVRLKNDKQTLLQKLLKQKSVSLDLIREVKDPELAVALVSDNKAVSFRDTHLEQLVRDTVNKQDGQLLQSDVLLLTQLQTYKDIGLTSLEGIAQLPNLNMITIYNNKVSDLSPLLELKNLKELYLSELPIQDFHLIGQMTWLERLALTNNNIGDISFLRPLTGLWELNLMSNNIKDLSPLTGMTNLAWLQAGFNQIEDLSPLKSLKNLRALHLTRNQVKNLEPISDMSGLYELQLEENQITDISPLANMPRLYALGLKDNPILTYVPVLYLFSQLTNKDFKPTEQDLQQTITFPDKGLEDAVRQTLKKTEGGLTLAEVESIYSLDASNKSIRSLSGMEHLIQLVSADFSGNMISDVSPLEHLTQLKKLSLSGNQVQNYNALHNVYRNLADKDFNSELKQGESITVNTFEELVDAADKTMEQLSQPITINVKAPALQNWNTLYTVYRNLFTKYTDSYGAYRYFSPSEVKFEKINFLIYSPNGKYDKISAIAKAESKSIHLDVAKYERPSIELNLKPALGIPSDDARIMTQANEIVRGLNSEMDKLAAIHDWVASHISYDYDTFNGFKNQPQDAIHALDTRQAICEGYANLTAALGRAASIPTQVVVGHVLSYFGETWDEIYPNQLFFKQNYHAWNQAYVNGRWVTLDTTWDSGSAATLADSDITSTANRNYFDPDPALFNTSHTFYIPQPTPEGLADFYFKLNDKDKKVVSELGDAMISNEGSIAYNFAVGHMRSGTVEAVISYTKTDKSNSSFVYTYARNGKGDWELKDEKKVDNYLHPTASFALDKY